MKNIIRPPSQKQIKIGDTMFLKSHCFKVIFQPGRKNENDNIVNLIQQELNEGVFSCLCVF
jgi:hypothetical protein